MTLCDVPRHEDTLIMEEDLILETFVRSCLFDEIDHENLSIILHITPYLTNLAFKIPDDNGKNHLNPSCRYKPPDSYRTSPLGERLERNGEE